MNYRLTLLEGLEVMQEDGRKLGRLMDVRSRAKLRRIERGEHCEADALLIGVSGWLEAMGLRQGGAREVPAKTIVAIESGKAIVRASPPGAREPRKRRGRR
jgi:sporulation protein YlmC with PRC-barrel domain